MLEQIINLWPAVVFITQGIIVTLQYSLISIFFGLIIGIILALLKTSRHLGIRLVVDSYVSIFRGTPLLIQLSIIYFGLPNLTGVKFSAYAAGILAFSLNSGAYIAEIIRSGIKAVDCGQSEAGRALGIPSRLIMRDIIFPQAIRHILPALVSELTNLIKESAIISVIGEMDIMRRANMVAAEQFNFFMPMLIAAITYYLLVLVISLLAKKLEKKLAL